MSNDIALGPVGLPNVGGVPRKPLHLVSLSKGKTEELFISLDRPELLSGFILCKGIYVNKPELEKIEQNTFSVEGIKELIVEILLPIHRVLSIKNLAFKAK